MADVTKYRRGLRQGWKKRLDRKIDGEKNNDEKYRRKGHRKDDKDKRKLKKNEYREKDGKNTETQTNKVGEK